MKIRHKEPGARFTAGAAANQIGRTVPVDIEGHEGADGLVVGAEVLDDGEALELTVEVSGDAAETLARILSPELRSFSIGL